MRLGSPRDPTWLDMPGGSSWLVDVHDPLAAEGYGRRRAQAAARLRPPGDEPDADALLDAELQADLQATVWLARRTVRDWRDVELDDGTPAPCDPDHVTQALCELPGAAVLFRNAYFGALAPWTVEKKGSATSPPGTGTAAPSAPAAGPTPPAADGASAAPTSPAAPAARRASRSGSSSAPPAPSGGTG